MTASQDEQQWDSRYRGAEGVWSAAPNPWVATTIGGWFTGRALDLGAGQGSHSVWLAALGWEVTAVDSSAAGIERGRSGAEDVGVQVDWVVADICTWEPPAAVLFDLVLVAYARHGQDVLARARDWLAPGGSLVVIGHGSGDLTEKVGASASHPPYTEAGLRAACRGLVVEQLAEVPRHLPDGDAADLALVARRPIREQP